MATEATTMTVKDFLLGSVGNIPVSDNTLKTCLYRVTAKGDSSMVDVSLDSNISVLSEKQRDLSLAWLYVAVAGYTAQSGNVTDKDADWEHSEGSFRITDKLRDLYKMFADELFAKWDEPTLFGDKWGFVGHGIRNPRNYRFR